MAERSEFTVTVASARDRRGRTFSLSTRFLVGIFVVLFTGMTLLVFSSVNYYQMWRQSADFARLQRQSDELRRHNDKSQLAARQLSDQIAALQITAQKLRILSGMDPDAMGGVGGPVDAADPILGLSERDILRHFQSLDRKRISLDAELRQLQDYYMTREILQAATPSIRPVRGYPSARFGVRADPFHGAKSFHPGIDISAPRGARVVATADGLVVFSGRRLGYGKLVTIEHKFGISTRYGHLDGFAVEAGQRVRKGDIIGYVGSTGRATGPHLHYEVRLNNQALNPFRFFGDDE